MPDFSSLAQNDSIKGATTIASPPEMGGQVINVDIAKASNANGTGSDLSFINSIIDDT